MPPTALWLILIFLVGLGIRIAWVLYAHPAPYGDSAWYMNPPTNLADGQGYVVSHHNPFVDAPAPPLPTAYYPPGYPFLLAGVWKAFGTGLTAGELLNAVLGALTIFFVFGIGRECFSQRVGITAAATYALLPNAVVWLPILLSETLFTFLFATALWMLVAWRPRRGISAAAASTAFGSVVAVAILTRGPGLVLLPIALIFWLQRDGWKPATRNLAFALGGAVLLVAPWTVRNWLVMDSAVPIATSVGVNLRIGHGPDATGLVTLLHDPIDGIPGWRSLDQPDWEVRGYRTYTSRAIAYAFDHPSRELELAGKKVRYLYRSDAEMLPALTGWGGKPLNSRLSDALSPLIDLSWYVLLFGAVGSAPLWLRKLPERLLFVSIVGFWTLFHIAFFGMARFHLPLFPVLTVAAAGGLWVALPALSSIARRIPLVRQTLPAPRT